MPPPTSPPMMAGVVPLEDWVAEEVEVVSRRRAVRRMGWMRALRATRRGVREASMTEIVRGCSHSVEGAGGPRAQKVQERKKLETKENLERTTQARK